MIGRLVRFYRLATLISFVGSDLPLLVLGGWCRDRRLRGKHTDPCADLPPMPTVFVCGETCHASTTNTVQLLCTCSSSRVDFGFHTCLLKTYRFFCFHGYRQ